ncbi:hypothetical protein EVAR_47074_1 [Eumeta japonica]|uniref:Amino acid transporter transmembrane domain-containing protein n=1 Tax=Eumeta variegata TaxID=151549 RepID=A0A4C1WP67_EUMVA|nr:hypothetical protein EVAR_47074_1 [Eumeta japonica]
MSQRRSSESTLSLSRWAQSPPFLPNLGSGLLAMPAAFKHAGLAVGALGIVVVSVVATHCVHILRKAVRMPFGRFACYNAALSTRVDIVSLCPLRCSDRPSEASGPIVLT